MKKGAVHPILVLILIILGLYLITNYSKEPKTVQIVIENVQFNKNYVEMKTNMLLDIYNNDRIIQSIYINNDKIEVRPKSHEFIPFKTGGTYIIYLEMNPSSRVELRVKSTIFG